MNFRSCPLTGWELEQNNFNPTKIDHFYFFEIKNEDKEYCFILEKLLAEDISLLEKNQHFFRWIFLNNLFSHNLKNESWDLLQEDPKKYSITKIEYQKYISDYRNIPPQEKLNHLLITLFKFSDESYFVRKKPENLILNTGFKNIAEMNLYINVLNEKKYIRFSTEYTSILYDDPNNELYYNFQFLYYGIQEVARLNESGQNSKRCFVAMSFDESRRNAREAIRKGINDTGHNAIFIDEIYPASDQTINDAIIAEIKRSKFLVSDFTKQSNGVYFEAGYALGRGLKVIYCCEKNDFEDNSHFDLKPFPHILYNSDEDLYKRLKYKIEAWIE